MSDLSPTAVAKRKQYILAVLILAVIVVLSMIGVYFTQDSPASVSATRGADIKTKSYIAPGEKIDPQDAWRGNADTRLNKFEARLKEAEAINADLKKKLDAKQTTGEAQKSAAPESIHDDEIDRRLADYEKRANDGTGYPGGTPSKPVDARSPSKDLVRGGRVPASTSNKNPTELGTQAPAIESDNSGIMTIKLRRPEGQELKKSSAVAGVQGNTSTNKANLDPKNVVKTTQNYLPSGMFGQAVVLSGLDAPTGGQAQTNPHPVLLQLRDLAILPNKYRYDWKSCTVTGAGYGDISSERAYIRTESLSCVSKDGKVLDVPIKGYIAGEDGKAGMRGRLVSKQGQALANALLAGVVSGIGSGLEKSSTIQSISPLGATSTVKSGSEYQAGIGQGVGRALDKLSNYYIQLAEKMFPVIEVDAGRVVDVVLTKGVLVDVDLQSSENGK